MGMDTFVVKLWVPPDQTSCGTDLRGLVRHVATGVETAFRGDDEVLRLLQVTVPCDRAPRHRIVPAPGRNACIEERPRLGTTSRDDVKERYVIGTEQKVVG